MTYLRGFSLAACLILAFATPSRGSVTLDFNVTNDPGGSLLPSNYGDNVSSASQDGFTYITDGNGWTPDVTLSIASPPIQHWEGEYGDLPDVIYVENSELYQFSFTLNAAPGFLVTLESFELATYVDSDPYTLPLIEVVGDTTYSLENETINTTSSVAFAPMITGSSIVLTFNLPVEGGQPTYTLGLSNLTFSQSAVPEPSTAVLIVAATLGMALRRSRRGRIADRVR